MQDESVFSACDKVTHVAYDFTQRTYCMAIPALEDFTGILLGGHGTQATGIVKNVYASLARNGVLRYRLVWL